VQAAADPGTLLITAETHRLVPGLFAVEDRGTQLINGIERPIHLYRVLQPTGARGRLEAAATRGLTRFVGREAELRLLMSRWDRVIESEGQVALITGEPGIGKSRLMRQFNEAIASRPHRWIQGIASSFSQLEPYYTIGQILRELLVSPAGEPATDQLVRLDSALVSAGLNPAEAVPLLVPLLHLPMPAKYGPSPLSPEHQRRRLLAILVEWLVRAAESFRW